MGNHNPKYNNKIIHSIELVTRNSFEFLYLIGRGGFSKVWKVKWKKTGTIFALKEMSKPRIIDKKCESTILLERDLLSKMNHPFIVNMHFSFQDINSLYLVMDLITGKDLRYHLSKEKKFSAEVSKFFLACTILGLEYIHYNNILHRDIKPDNLVLDKNGYVKITDFGISREIGKLQKDESSGTPGYMAPEVMCGKPHNIDSDYYCLGMMAYEFMKGVRPFICKSNLELKKKVMENDIVINKLELPEGWGIEAGDFINRLIKRKQNERLGHGGDTEVKNHLWFKGFRWDKLYRMELKAPFIPDEEDGNEKNIFIPPIDNEMMKRYKKIMNSKEYKVVFKNFLFFNLYDQNLNHEKYKNPHEIYEAQLIHKNKNFNNDENKKKNNIKDVEDNKDDVIDIKKEKEKMKSFNQPIKNKFNYMDIFHKKNYDFFEKSQNIPNINKFLKNEL